MSFVKIKKIKQLETSKTICYESINEVLNSTRDNKSLPVEYEIEGYLKSLIGIGLPVVVLRTCRNSEPSVGLFITTTVRAAAPGWFMTDNSTYTVEYLEEKS